MGHYLFNFSKKGASKGKSLRAQAGELLTAGLWGIGSKTPHRNVLDEGDQALIYVGAPERAFIGHASLSSGVHAWSEEEQAQYPHEGTFSEGVAFSKAEMWPHPVPLKSMIQQLELGKTNPQGHFMSGVVRIYEKDFQAVLKARGHTKASGEPVLQATVDQAPGHPTPQRDAGLPSQLFSVTETLKAVLAEGTPPTLSEWDTRAFFIDKYLHALGYTGIEDIQHGAAVESGSFPDYVLKINGKPAMAVEAKKLGKLDAEPKQEAAQLVSYCATLGVRWGALTDGRRLLVYDAPVLDTPPSQRVVLSVDLADYADREDFETRIYPDLELIAKSQMESRAGLERRAAQEAVRELLTTAPSKTVSALRKELKDKKKLQLSTKEVVELVSDLLT